MLSHVHSLLTKAMQAEVFVLSADLHMDQSLCWKKEKSTWGNSIRLKIYLTDLKTATSVIACV